MRQVRQPPHRSAHGAQLPGMLRRLPILLPAEMANALDRAAQQAHASPTPAQKNAGNYRKGHYKVLGFRVSIENPRGSIRSGQDRFGNPWSVVMPCHYGYLRGVIGADKDHLDVMLGPHPHSQLVCVVDQVDPDTGKFDEHKCVMGCNTVEEAKALYMGCYSPGWKGFGAITPMTLPQFRSWCRTAHKGGPAAKAMGRLQARLSKAIAPCRDLLIYVTDLTELEKLSEN